MSQKTFIHSDSGKIIVDRDLFVSLVYKGKDIYYSYESDAERDIKSFLQNLK